MSPILLLLSGLVWIFHYSNMNTMFGTAVPTIPVKNAHLQPCQSPQVADDSKVKLK